MKNFSQKYITTARAILPSPYVIAILLTITVFVISLAWGNWKQDTSVFHQLGKAWYNGLFQTGLLAFTVQMMLILVLGHVLALTKPIDQLLNRLLVLCDTTAKAAAVTAFIAMMMAFLNWGLGLIVGALLARKISMQAQDRGFAIHYPLVAAAGYTGLMVWHGGLSGSAPVTVAKANHSLVNQMGVIYTDATIGSTMNIVASFTILFVITAACYLLGSKLKGHQPTKWLQPKNVTSKPQQFIGIEKLEQNSVFGKVVGLGMISYVVYLLIQNGAQAITLNFIIFTFWGLGMMLHQNIPAFLNASEQAIKGSTGILIQFPLYFGIMGVMQASGLVQQLSVAFASIANAHTFPLFTFFSAGLVNIFVPSGGGQWQVQGPLIIETANQLNVPYWKAIMSLAYGDQITNMLQPFWALPLLGITGLSAKDILPYTLVFFALGVLVYAGMLVIF